MKKLMIAAGTMIAFLLTTGNFAQAQEHKKISSQGQGAIIGGAGGAIAGGLIGHGVKGALIGGAIGAGGGYIIGNEHRRRAIQKRENAAAYARTHRRHHYHHVFANNK